MLYVKSAKYSDKNPIKYYRSTYNCVPPWVLFKGVFLSTLVNFVRLFKEPQKRELASKMYGLPKNIEHMDAITNLLTDTLFYLFLNIAISLLMVDVVYNYIPHSKTRLSDKSSQCLENLIADFNHNKTTFGLASLLFLLDLFKYKQPYFTIQNALNAEVNRHCSIYLKMFPCFPL